MAGFARTRPLARRLLLVLDIMASTTTFRSFVGKLLPTSNVLNGAGAPAYALSAKHALAQYAATGCFNATYYATAQQQLDQVIAGLLGRAELLGQDGHLQSRTRCDEGYAGVAVRCTFGRRA